MSKNNQAAAETPNISLIGAGTVIIGDIIGKGDIRIDGTLKGKIQTEGKLVLGNTARMEGEFIANSADISGKVFGKMQIAELLTMKSTSRIEGDIKVGKISIEQGAVFTGNCIMSNSNTNSAVHAEQPDATEKE